MLRMQPRGIVLMGSKAFNADANNVISLTDMGFNLAPNDLVVVSLSAVSTNTNDRTGTAAITGYSSTALKYQTGPSTATNLVVQHKVMGGVPDASFTMGSGAGNWWSGTVFVFRGVDVVTPIDVAAVIASGTATDLADPGAVTPAAAGALIHAIYAAAQATATAWTAPSGISGFQQISNPNAATKPRIGAGYAKQWAAAAFNPAAVTGGEATKTSDQWVGITLALRPA